MVALTAAGALLHCQVTGASMPRRTPRPSSRPRSPSRAKRPRPGPQLLVGTRKGAFIYRADAGRSRWTLAGPHLLGNIVHHVVADPRDGRTWLMAARTGHLGPTIFRSSDRGRTWSEAKRPPAFPKAAEGQEGKAVEFTCWLTPGHAGDPGLWYAGVSPHGLFRSTDAGETWEEVSGFTRGVLQHPEWSPLFFAVPEGGMTHSILVDPRDGAHLYVALSVGGTFESRDAGATWTPLNRGVATDFQPTKDPEVGHDPHCMVLHPLMPDRLWQQNHCGIYRLDRPGEVWERVGLGMPKAIGDIGFPIVLHPRRVDTAWVVPMDGTSVWPRTSPGGRPAVFRTRNAGRTWQRQADGLPGRDAWLTVKRQAFCADGGDPVGLYLGSTSGSIWHSRDEGGRWRRLGEHLPHIYSLSIAEPD
jgi:photosystem II stability/assembly factor-like uncharacterized protein